MSTKLHAKYSASGSERWLACSGSIALSEKAPPAPDSKYAIEGTKAHDALEFLLKNRRKRFEAEQILRKRFGVQITVHAMRTLREIESLAPKGTEILSETKVDLGFVREGMFGTLDAAVLDHFGTLTSIDYKYGQGVKVEPQYGGKANSQLVYYALGLAHLYDYNFARVKLTIIQPRFVTVAGPVRSHSISMKELLGWRDVFAEGVEKCESNRGRPLKKLDLNAGPWCRFCPAKGICPESKNAGLDYRGHAKPKAENDFDTPLEEDADNNDDAGF